ncbi:exported hypothetical protein [Candidatus Sulfopaludibacter sp. SbA4]|nr:exported hypothetical protein [Candidatus Sulfopaludibacter sp. SbA4]
MAHSNRGARSQRAASTLVSTLLRTSAMPRGPLLPSFPSHSATGSVAEAPRLSPCLRFSPVNPRSRRPSAIMCQEVLPWQTPSSAAETFSWVRATWPLPP